MVSVLKEIPLKELAPSPSNSRRHFDPLKLDELARSIGEKGIIEPIVVRQLKDAGKGEAPFEIVAGERRWRAAGIAELDTVPCIVRELSDIEVLEVQAIENLQRDDLHPLEEAEGYDQLIKRAQYDVARIASRIGRSEKYVYDRVKLLQLTPASRKIFLDGEMTAGHAILLARLAPEDQERAIGDENGWHSGLFAHEVFDENPADLFDEFAPPPRKPVSVREFDTWINDNVRFRPDEVDLPNLFPETATALERAEEEELKVVKITRDYRVPDGAKDSKERTYGAAHWKRADDESEYEFYSGKEVKSKTCEHSVLGVVVAGPGRGEAFAVCVNKKKCTVHWAAEQKRKAKAKTGDESWQEQDRRRQESFEKERKREEGERDRWLKARPQILKALAEKLATAPAHPKSELGRLLIERARGYAKPVDGLERGKTPEDLVRYCGYQTIATMLMDKWRAPREGPKRLRAFGIDVKKILADGERRKGGVKKAAAPNAKKRPVKKGTRPRKGS